MLADAMQKWSPCISMEFQDSYQCVSDRKRPGGKILVASLLKHLNQASAANRLTGPPSLPATVIYITQASPRW